MKCIKCGEEITQTHGKFCENCGHPLPLPQDIIAEQLPIQPSLVEEKSAPPVRPQVDFPSIIQPNRWVKAILLFLAAVIVILAGVVFWMASENGLIPSIGKAEETTSPAAIATPSSVTADLVTDVPADPELVKETIYLHYNNIPYNLPKAFSCFSKKLQGKWPNWGESGCESTLGTTVDYAEVTDITDNRATANVGMTSRESGYSSESGDPIIIYRIWRGTWQLVYEDGLWKGDAINLQEVNSYAELDESALY